MAATSWGVTGRSTTCSPRSLLRPMTWPIRIDPQPMSTLKASPQWSRPASLFILRRSAKLAHRDNQCRFVEPTLNQVVDERGNGSIKRRDQLPGPFLGLELRRGAVVVPGHAVDRHERRSRFDQPAGEQRALAEGVPAVAVAELGVFAMMSKAAATSLPVSISKARPR